MSSHLRRRYVDFEAITNDALVYTANALHVELTAAQNISYWTRIGISRPWRDTADGPRRLARQGFG